MKVLRLVTILTVLSALIGGAHMFVTGSGEADRQRMEQSIGRTSIPADSSVVRAVYDQPVGTDSAALARAMQILGYADKWDQARLLARFFSYCGVQRLLGEGDACSRETVRTAVGKVTGLSPNTQWPVESELETKLTQALSVSLADEEVMRRSTSELQWRRLSYDSPGILRYDSPTNGAYIFIAARNNSAWEITGFSTRVRLQLAGAATFELKCRSWVPFPFSWPEPLGPGKAAVGYCERPDTIKLDDLLAAVHDAQRSPLSVWVEEFAVKDPLVRVIDLGAAPTHSYAVRLVGDLPAPSRSAGAPSPSMQVARELATVDCSQTGTCPSAYQKASLSVFNFLQHNLPLIPAIVGLLLGIGVGAMFRRSLLTGGLLSAAMLACIIGGLAYLFHRIDSGGGEKGFALMGMVGLTQVAAIGFVIWLPALFAGVLLARFLWARAE